MDLDLLKAPVALRVDGVHEALADDGHAAHRHVHLAQPGQTVHRVVQRLRHRLGHLEANMGVDGRDFLQATTECFAGTKECAIFKMIQTSSSSSFYLAQKHSCQKLEKHQNLKASRQVVTETERKASCAARSCSADTTHTQLFVTAAFHNLSLTRLTTFERELQHCVELHHGKAGLVVRVVRVVDGLFRLLDQVGRLLHDVAAVLEQLVLQLAVTRRRRDAAHRRRQRLERVRRVARRHPRVVLIALRAKQAQIQ